MRNRILEIVVLMVDFIQEHQGQVYSSEELSSSLKTMGYSDYEISSAYLWLLERFDNAPEKYYSDFKKIRSTNRVLTDLERRLLTSESQGYLLKLLSLSIIEQEQFESVLEQASLYGIQPVTCDQVKQIVASLIIKGISDIDGISRDDSNTTSIFIN